MSELLDVRSAANHMTLVMPPGKFPKTIWRVNGAMIMAHCTAVLCGIGPIFNVPAEMSEHGPRFRALFKSGLGKDWHDESCAKTVMAQEFFALNKSSLMRGPVFDVILRPEWSDEMRDFIENHARQALTLPESALQEILTGPRSPYGKGWAEWETGAINLGCRLKDEHIRAAGAQIAMV